MQSWMMPSLNGNDDEIWRFTNVDTISLLTETVMSRSDAVISHSKEVEQSQQSENATYLGSTYSP
jgi:hypothetical protein